MSGLFLHGSWGFELGFSYVGSNPSYALSHSLTSRLTSPETSLTSCFRKIFFFLMLFDKPLTRRAPPSARIVTAVPIQRTVTGCDVHFHFNLPEVTENLQQQRRLALEGAAIGQGLVGELGGLVLLGEGERR